METDKATAPVPAPVSGTITSIDVAEGAVVKEGVVVGDIEVAGETKTDAPSVEPPKELPKKAAQSSPNTTAQTTITTDVKYESTGNINDVKSAPSIKKFAHLSGLDLNRISGTGMVSVNGTMLQRMLHSYNRRRFQSNQQTHRLLHHQKHPQSQALILRRLVLFEKNPYHHCAKRLPII